MIAERIKCLIIDDDAFIRELLQDKLDLYFPEVEMLSTASCGREGLQKIVLHKPDLIFLDVEMTDMTGFEMLAQLSDITFQTIFITSYSHYAIKAIRFNALDYLLKPIDLGELKRAVKRCKSRVSSNVQKENLSMAIQNMSLKHVADHLLILKTQDGDLKLAVKDIVHIEGDRNYSYIHLKNGSKKLVSKTLSILEELLDSKGFFRCHRSHIINVDHISNYSGGHVIVTSDNSKIPISRRKKQPFQVWYEGLE